MVEFTTPPRAAFFWYLTSNSLSMAALSLQNLLITWILVGVLQETASVYGESRALMNAAPLVILLIGGFAGDRFDAKRFLFVLSLITAAMPILLAFGVAQLSVWMVIAFGAGTSLLTSLADPAKQGMINRISNLDIQRSIALVSIVPSLVGIAAMSLGVKLEQFGLVAVLVILAAFYLFAALAVLGLPRLPPIRQQRMRLMDGVRGVLSVPIIRNLFGMNFVSAIFNAGGYMVVMPYILMEHYAGGSLPLGDGTLLTAMFIAFTIGSTGSTIALFWLMPLKKPGKIYISLQLLRILIIGGIWLQPSPWLFMTFVLLWGINMGVTSTLVRSTVQEMAPPEHRSKVLGFYMFTFMLSSIFAALILGYVVEELGSLNALLPGVVISVGLYIYGRYFSGYWEFRSPSAL